MDQRSFKYDVALALVFVAAGVALLVWGLREHARARQSRYWPTVPGVVERAWITTSAHGEDASTIYTAHVRYTYRVDGTAYASTRVRFGGEVTFDRRQQAQDFLAAYPEGGSVTVHYNPADPRDAVLETTVQAGLGLLLAGGGFALAGLWLLWNTVALRRFARMFPEAG